MRRWVVVFLAIAAAIAVFSGPISASTPIGGSVESRHSSGIALVDLNV